MRAAEKHWYAKRIDQPRGDRNVTIPKTFEMQIDLGSMQADVADCPARRDQFLTQFERCWNADRLDRGVDSETGGHAHHSLHGPPSGRNRRRLSFCS